MSNSTRNHVGLSNAIRNIMYNVSNSFRNNVECAQFNEKLCRMYQIQSETMQNVFNSIRNHVECLIQSEIM